MITVEVFGNGEMVLFKDDGRPRFAALRSRIVWLEPDDYFPKTTITIEAINGTMRTKVVDMPFDVVLGLIFGGDE